MSRVRIPCSPANALYQVAELRQELEGYLGPLLEKQSGLEKKLQEVTRDVDLSRRQLRVVKATEEQLRAQGEPLEGAGVQVSGAVELQLGQPVCRKRELMFMLPQPTPAGAFEGDHPASPHPGPPPQPLPTRAVPATLWEDHLVPLLTRQDAARLQCTCKALSILVREYFKDLSRYTVTMDEVKAALTTFPRARTIVISGGDPGYVNELLEWLREGGQGRHLERVQVEGSSLDDFVHRALQETALPSIRSVDVCLSEELHRASLTDAMRELQLTNDASDVQSLEAQLSALGLVRQLPALTKLEIGVGFGDEEPPRWPPFIPPSLKALHIVLDQLITDESFLRAVPGMLAGSGAKLEHLEVGCTWAGEQQVGEGLVYLAQALHCCSPTLKGFFLKTPELRPSLSQWADFLVGVSACGELQMLVLPHTKVEPLFRPGTVFARLVRLEIWDSERERQPDAGVMGLWELMASGGLPALVKLKVRFTGRWWSAEVMRTRVAPAFEAVAGTLTHLQLGKYGDDMWLGVDLDLDVAYELGVALGKLRRLNTLSISMSSDGRAFDALAQGLAASGQDPPLPLLWRLELLSSIWHNGDLVASLLLPSVRILALNFKSDVNTILIMACGLRQAGFKHVWATIQSRRWDDERRDTCELPEWAPGWTRRDRILQSHRQLC
jgi:hypothetical protein